MAMTRSWLAALGIEDAKIDEIVKAHSETLTGLKTERDELREKLKELPEIQKELENLKATEKGKEDWEAKYNDLKSEFDSYKADHDKDNDLQKKLDDLKKEYDAYKADVEKKTATESKRTAYKDLLLSVGVSEKRIPAILKVTDLDEIKLDKDGKITDADKVKASIKDDWAEFIVTKGEKGADTPTPPANAGGKMTKEDIIKIQDPVERQQKIAENHELFGI